MRTRTILTLLASLTGIALFFVLFPRFDVSKRTWRFSISRQQAQAAAVKTAREYGVEAGGWTRTVTYDENRSLLEAKRAAPDDPVLSGFEAQSVSVLFQSPDNRETVIVTLTPQGSAMSFQRRSPARAYARREPEGEDQARRELAQRLGETALSYRIAAAGVRTQIGSRWVWERVSERKEGILARFEVVVRDQRIVRVSHSCQVSEQVTAAVQDRTEGSALLWLGLTLPLGLAILLAAGWTTFLQLARRKDHVRFGLRTALLLAVFMAPILVTGNLRNDLAQTSGGRGPELNWWIPGVIGTTGVLALTAMLASAGYALVQPRERLRWAGLSLIAHGRIWSRVVGREVFLGLAAGAGLASVPYLLELAPGWIPPPVRWTGPKFFGEPSPLAYAFYRLLPWETLGLFAFVVPLMLKLIRRTTVAWAAAAAAGIAWTTAMWGPIQGSVGADFACGSLIWSGFALIYQSAGLLGVWMAPLGLSGAIISATLLNSPGGDLADSGIRAASVCLALLAFCAAIWIFGKRDSEEAVAASWDRGQQAASHSESDRLRAELDVARRAQEEMLRGALPKIPGFSVAAACEPARQVGGDLFDFLEFQDSRWGLCVADVSGKGLAAALYMTLTKGMLASARLHSSNIEEIVTRLNHHLGLAGKRRTFVTMSLASLDPASRKLQHVRAGHNPPMRWHAAERRTELLMPKGIGLGLTMRDTFRQNLESQEIQFEDGDAVVFYSDGLVECMNESKEQFGERRIEEALRSHSHLDAPEICRGVLDAARQFRGEAEPHDDLTILILKAESRGREAAA